MPGIPLGDNSLHALAALLALYPAGRVHERELVNITGASPSVVHRALQRFTAEGLLTKEDESGYPTGCVPRCFYALTDAGREAVDGSLAAINRLRALRTDAAT